MGHTRCIRAHQSRTSWGDEVGSELIVRPHKTLLRDTLFVFLAFCVPTFAVLYWLNIPTGTWLPVLVAQAFITLFYVLSLVASYRIMIRIDETTISERGFFRPLTSFPLDTVGGMVLLEMYAGGALDTNLQLFVTDTAGKLLIRMRGQFWSRDDIDSLANEIDKPIVRVQEPVTLADINHLRPELLYWFERRPRRRSPDNAADVLVPEVSDILFR